MSGSVAQIRASAAGRRPSNVASGLRSAAAAAEQTGKSAMRAAPTINAASIALSYSAMIVRSRAQAGNRGNPTMTDLPSHVEIHEEGPREGFQIEPGPIPTADKIRLIEALAETGLHHIQACSFVNTRLVPGWADAEAVVAGFTAKPGVEYTGLFFNGNGL